MMQRARSAATAVPYFSRSEQRVWRADCSPCGNYRWTLTRMWDIGDHVCFCGLHPSFADGDDDHLIAQFARLARAWGYSGFTAVNLYPLRSLSSAQCLAWAARQARAPMARGRDPIQANLAVITREARTAALFVACWGEQDWHDAWINKVLEQVQANGPSAQDVYCFALTTNNAPADLPATGLSADGGDARPQLWRAAYR